MKKTDDVNKRRFVVYLRKADAWMLPALTRARGKMSVNRFVTAALKDYLLRNFPNEAAKAFSTMSPEELSAMFQAGIGNE